MLFSLSQDKTSFQNLEDTLQRESKCAKRRFWFFIAKSAIWRLRKAAAKYFIIICKDNVVQNSALKVYQFGIKCSTERKRINLCPIIDCIWVFVRYLCWAVGGKLFAQKRVVYLFRGDISDMERATVQFNGRCVRDGSYFIFTDRRSNNCFQSDGRVNNSKSLPHKNMKFDRRQTTATCLR